LSNDPINDLPLAICTACDSEMPSMGEMMAMSTTDVHISTCVGVHEINIVADLQQKGVLGKRCSPHM
jgi:hypothetical protein